MEKANILVSTDKSKLDVKLIYDFLTKSYWAKGRTQEQVQTTIDNSLCFGIYLDDTQIGFARVMTDGVVFAYLMDVFILEEYRNKGFSKILLQEIFNHPKLVSIPKWQLGTQDAHSLYRQFGFTELSHPERLMEWIKNKK